MTKRDSAEASAKRLEEVISCAELDSEDNFWTTVENEINSLNNRIRAKIVEENPGEIVQRFFHRNESVETISNHFQVKKQVIENVIRIGARKEFRQR